MFLKSVVFLAGAITTVGGTTAPPSALTPPRGWNSYDSYTWKVTEADFLANCAAMAQALGPSGYEYCVVDYLWFQDLDFSGGGGDDGSGGGDRAARRERDAPLRDPITTVHIDAYGRPVPAPDRWPSAWSADGKTSLGFAPIAAKVKAMGMKLGIHIMRGVSLAAVAAETPVLGFEGRFTAADIANTSDAALCPWWKGVRSVNMSHPAGQAFYDSLYAQYAEDWGVAFVKNDCVFGNQFVPDQIHAQARSIRTVAARRPGSAPIVYSLSPGGGFAEATLNIKKIAPLINGDVNMYRVTGDDWDSWGAVASHFGVAARAANASLVGAEGLGAPGSRSWPDLDMLPFGAVTTPNSPGRLPHHNSSLSRAQQHAQMTLWAVAKSPLMFGGEATRLDDFTRGLLGNAEVLALNAHSSDNRAVASTGRTASGQPFADAAAWGASLGDKTYVAVFNTGTHSSGTVAVALRDLGLKGAQACDVFDVWGGAPAPAASCAGGQVSADVAETSVVLYRLTKCV